MIALSLLFFKRAQLTVAALVKCMQDIDYSATTLLFRQHPEKRFSEDFSGVAFFVLFDSRMRERGNGKNDA